jgi:hypothetical protein
VLDDTRFEPRAGERDVSLLQKSRSSLDKSILLFNEDYGSLSGIRRPECKGDHSSQSSAEVKESGGAYFLPLYAPMVWIKTRLPLPIFI